MHILKTHIYREKNNTQHYYYTVYFSKKKDLINSLKKSGINKGDIVFFNTSIGTVGIPKKVYSKKNELCQFFFDAFKETVGKKEQF